MQEYREFCKAIAGYELHEQTSGSCESWVHLSEQILSPYEVLAYLIK